MSVGLIDRAEALYAQVAEADPQNSIAVVGLARVRLERGDEAGALELARRALAIDPENAAAARMVERLEEVIAYRGEAAAAPEPARAVEPVAPERTSHGAGAEPNRRPRPNRPAEPVPAHPRPQPRRRPRPRRRRSGGRGSIGCSAAADGRSMTGCYRRGVRHPVDRAVHRGRGHRPGRLRRAQRTRRRAVPGELRVVRVLGASLRRDRGASSPDGRRPGDLGAGRDRPPAPGGRQRPVGRLPGRAGRVHPVGRDAGRRARDVHRHPGWARRCGLPGAVHRDPGRCEPRRPVRRRTAGWLRDADRPRPGGRRGGPSAAARDVRCPARPHRPLRGPGRRGRPAERLPRRRRAPAWPTSDRPTSGWTSPSGSRSDRPTRVARRSATSTSAGRSKASRTPTVWLVFDVTEVSPGAVLRLVDIDVR